MHAVTWEYIYISSIATECSSLFLQLFPIPFGNSFGLKGNKCQPSKIPHRTLRTRIGWCIIWLPDYSSVLEGGYLQWGLCSKSSFNIKRFVFRSMDRIEQTPVNTKGARACCLWFVTMGNQYSIEGSCVAESMNVSFNISVIQTIWICDLP